jgi:putative membrane protein
VDVVVERGGVASGRVGRRVWGVAGTLLLGAMLAAQVASGLQPEPVRLTSVVVLLLAGAAVAFAAAWHGIARAAAAFGAAVAAGYAAEWVGVRTGVPFGEYRYTGVLWPAVGDVPVIVALAWGGMGLAAYAVATSVVRSGGFLRSAVVGAFALTAWDLFLDPQMLRLGLWEWVHPGPYRGVPISNLVGWLVVSFLVMALIGAILRTSTAGNGTGRRLAWKGYGRRPAGDGNGCEPTWAGTDRGTTGEGTDRGTTRERTDRGTAGEDTDRRSAREDTDRGSAGEGTGLVVLYTAMAVMETIGFAVVFEPPDPLVAVAGGVGMGLFAVPAWVRRGRRG